MSNFESLGLSELLLRALKAQGYENPTPIQAQAIPPLLKDQDLVGIAQTGTGKTAAFVLPMLERLYADRLTPDQRDAEEGWEHPGAAPKHCHNLILAPTRELASQIADTIRAHSKYCSVVLTVVVGGANPVQQMKKLARGSDIVVATPGRLEDHLARGNISLRRTRMVVLDEADQMLDLGFFPAIRRILGKLPETRQTALLSATMPAQIRALADEFLRDPTEVSVAPASTPVALIDQKVLPTPAGEKRDRLTAVLREPEVTRAIVFTRTKHGADRVVRHLEKAGLAAAAIHGNKSQPQREKALAAFKSGKVRALIATDIAARGIDIDHVSHVINFELPNVPESYVHRIGRTARAGNTGVAISLMDPAEVGLMRDIERLMGRLVPGSGNTEIRARGGKGGPGGKAGGTPHKGRRSGNGKPGANASPAGHAPGGDAPRRPRPHRKGQRRPAAGDQRPRASAEGNGAPKPSRQPRRGKRPTAETGAGAPR